VTELEIGREFYTLCGGDVSIGDEDHVCDWTTWEDSSADKLADQIDAAMLVCDGHDDSNWDEKNRADT
jgi:hypothetical protein